MFDTNSILDIYLSIIIVSYNSKQFLKNCLESILINKNDLKLEIIVVDNNSSDGTAVLVKSNFPDVKIIINKTNKGFSKAVNQGILKSKGKFIFLLNPDVMISNDLVFKKMLNFIETHENIGALGCQILNPDGSFQLSFGRHPSLLTEFLYQTGLFRIFTAFRPTTKKVTPFQRWFLNFNKIHYIDWISGACFLISKQVLNQVGLLDENFFMYFEDIDLCFRIRKIGKKICYFPSVSIKHHTGGSSKNILDLKIYYLTKATVYFFSKHYNTLYQILIIMLLIFGYLLRWISWKLIGLIYSKKRRSINKLTEGYFKSVLYCFHSIQKCSTNS